MGMKTLKEILLEKLKIGKTSFMLEKLKINSKTKINQYEKLTTSQQDQLKKLAFLEIDPWIPKIIDREYFEGFVEKILKSHSNEIDDDLYHRLHDYINNHIEDTDIEKCLMTVMNS